jgi:hypothetical protein
MKLLMENWREYLNEKKNPRIPRKKGQPAKSKKHSDLYTDEDPKGTIHGLGYKDEATARASVSKIRNSSRSHAHKTQAAIAMEQRAKAAGKTKEAAIFRKFIEQQKKKTKAKNKTKNEQVTLNEISVFEKDAAVNTVLSRLGSSEHYPKIDDAKVFLNRQASMLMIRVPMVHQMIRVINQDLSITEQDVLEILLQRALKGRTYEALTKSEQEYMNKYGLKYPEEPEEKPELPSYSREDIPPELMDAGTQVFVPDYAKKESIIRENSGKENNVAIADALLSLTLNANMQGGIGPQVLFKMSDTELMQQIKNHNHRKDEVSDQELYNYIRG